MGIERTESASPLDDNTSGRDQPVTASMFGTPDEPAAMAPEEGDEVARWAADAADFGDLVARGMRLRKEYDAEYSALDDEQRRLVERTARSYERAPFLALTLPFSPGSGLLKAFRAIALRDAWSSKGTELSRYAAIMNHRMCLDPTKGTGARRLRAIKAAYTHEMKTQGDPEPRTSQIPTEQPLPRPRPEADS